MINLSVASILAIIGMIFDKDSCMILNLYQQNDKAIIQVCDQGEGILLSQ